jgi:hypothetical protein
MVDAGLARRIARDAVPVGLRTVSDGSGGADRVASAIVHVETISAVEADEVLSALKASSGTALTD